MPELENIDNEASTDEVGHHTPGPPGAKAANSDETVLWRRGYKLGKVLGEGSYAKVYLAEYSEAHIKDRKQKLACKVIDGSAAPRDFIRRFFPREVEIMSRINHQNLVRVHSILQRKQKYFLFMQFCENGDLLDFIRQNGAIREKQCRIWFCQIIRGLHYLHERNIAHRDMKCENILLTKSFNVKISDFGFARYILPEEGKSETFCGSVSYAPPEIIRGHPYEPKGADLWSIGVILFVMLNKSMPFDDGSLKKLYENQMSRHWKFRNKMKDMLSTDVKAFLYVLLEPFADKRKSLPELWTDPWIQKGSNIDLQLERETNSKIAINKSIVMEKASRVQRANASIVPDVRKSVTIPEQAHFDKVLTTNNLILQPPVKIIDADTAEVKPFGQTNEHEEESQESQSKNSSNTEGDNNSHDPSK